MKQKKLFIIIPTAILIIAFISLFFIRYSNPICGDGLCEKSELDTCEIDCKSNCIQATGATSGDEIEERCSIGWSASYMKGIDDGYVKPKWITQNNEIDFLNSEIQELARELKRDTVKDTARAIADWTYKNIRYDFTDTYDDCHYYKASQILERGSGVCSTMSKLNIALLRANGIPAYSITGCFKFNEACKLQQTFFTGRFPKFVNITIDETGYAPTLGYLHNWVVFPLYNNGQWEEVILESTAGIIYEANCINYREYYTAPSDGLACGLSSVDSKLYDCKEW